MKEIKFKIYTLGCKVNQYDSRLLETLLKQAGLKSAEKDCDLVIINTCSVTQSAARKSKRVVSKARKENPGAKMVIMGCVVEVKREEMEKLGADLIWGTGGTKKLVAEILKLFRLKRKITSAGSLVSEDRARYFLKVQDGCEQFCAYCIIPYTRGKLKSRPRREILKEVKNATEAGYSEVILSGIHLGLYGAEQKDKYGLTEFLEEIIQIQGLGRVRLSSIEVTEIPTKLIKLIKKSPGICNHLHISLQSGSDKILEAMNRPYSTKYFQDKIREIRKEIPEIALSTDVIVGFPGESKTDFKTTYNFIENLKFSRLHVFPFSAHPETPAFNLEGKISPEEKKRRADELRRLGKELEKEYRHKFRSKELEVVIENQRDGKFMGKTQYFFDILFNKKDISDVTCPRDDRLIGKLVKVKN